MADYMAGEIAARKRRQVAPGTIEREEPDLRLQDEIEREKLPELDPKKAPAIAGDANGGGYNAQSAANEQATPGGRVTNVAALSAPRELATAKARQVIDPYAGLLNRPGPPSSFFTALTPEQLGQAAGPYGGYFPGPQPAIPNVPITGLPPPAVAPPPPTPVPDPTGTITAGQAGGVAATTATGTPTPTTPAPAVAPAGVVSPEEAAKYRSSIQAQADQQANVVKRDLNSARERLRGQAAESAARRGVGSASGATGSYYRTIDQNIAEQLALRMQDIETSRQVQLDALERDLKDRELKAQEFEQRRVQSYLDWQNKQPPSFSSSILPSLFQAGVSTLNPLAGAFIGQTGLFKPETTLPVQQTPYGAGQIGGSGLGYEDPLLDELAGLRQLYRGVTG